jgi:hypothetical protein
MFPFLGGCICTVYFMHAALFTLSSLIVPTDPLLQGPCAEHTSCDTTKTAMTIGLQLEVPRHLHTC